MNSVTALLQGWAEEVEGGRGGGGADHARTGRPRLL